MYLFSVCAWNRSISPSIHPPSTYLPGKILITTSTQRTVHTCTEVYTTYMPHMHTYHTTPMDVVSFPPSHLTALPPYRLIPPLPITLPPYGLTAYPHPPPPYGTVQSTPVHSSPFQPKHPNPPPSTHRSTKPRHATPRTQARAYVRARPIGRTPSARRGWGSGHVREVLVEALGLRCLMCVIALQRIGVSRSVAFRIVVGWWDGGPRRIVEGDCMK